MQTKKLIQLQENKGVFMGVDDKKKNTKNNKKEDGKFSSKNIKHDQQAESARAVYGLKDIPTEIPK